MKCAWNELLAIVPQRIRMELNEISYSDCQEIRLREGAPPELKFSNSFKFLSGQITQSDLDYVINAASRYSPWTSTSLRKGYLTAPGGHRIGLCGDVILDNCVMTGFQKVRSLCIRIAKDFEGISQSLSDVHGSILILGAPGWGKTTLLRDLIRSISKKYTISVVDERGELFPHGFSKGVHTDVLCGCFKSIGIEMVLKAMGPKYIAVDEITSQEDCIALMEAANCGVNLLATVHAASIQDLKHRPIYQSLLNCHIFQTYVVLSQDQSWHLERIKQ